MSSGVAGGTFDPQQALDVYYENEPGRRAVCEPDEQRRSAKDSG